MPISYATAAARADSALERVECVIPCPDCGQPVACTVNCTDVTVADCADMADQCYGVTRLDTLATHALDRAAAERAELCQHYRESR